MPASALARDLCTIVADPATGAVLLSEGDCETRVTPASTFKVALAAMGYDAGFLTDAETPKLTIRKGEPDWGGEAWRQPTGPAAWMKHSVVWYSQRITAALGRERLETYARAFGYGNADLSGDPGKDNGLERAWIASSLRIAPREQVAFLGKLVTGTLPIAPDATRKTMAIVETWPSGGWAVSGKTGTAFPRKADGSFDRARGWGWFVGWARKDGTTLVFARLAQDESRNPVSGGLRARDALLADWPALAARLKR